MPAKRKASTLTEEEKNKKNKPKLIAQSAHPSSAAAGDNKSSAEKQLSRERVINDAKALAKQHVISHAAMTPALHTELVNNYKDEFTVYFDVYNIELEVIKTKAAKVKQLALQLAKNDAFNKTLRKKAEDFSGQERVQTDDFFNSHFYPAYKAAADKYIALIVRAINAGKALAIQHQKKSLPQREPNDSVFTGEAKVYEPLGNAYKESFLQTQDILNKAAAEGEKLGTALALTKASFEDCKAEVSAKSKLSYIDTDEDDGVVDEESLPQIQRKLYLRGAEHGFKFKKAPLALQQDDKPNAATAENTKPKIGAAADNSAASSSSAAASSSSSTSSSSAASAIATDHKNVEAKATENKSATNKRKDNGDNVQQDPSKRLKANNAPTLEKSVNAARKISHNKSSAATDSKSNTQVEESEDEELAESNTDIENSPAFFQDPYLQNNVLKLALLKKQLVKVKRSSSVAEEVDEKSISEAPAVVTSLAVTDQQKSDKQEIAAPTIVQKDVKAVSNAANESEAEKEIVTPSVIRFRAKQAVKKYLTDNFIKLVNFEIALPPPVPSSIDESIYQDLFNKCLEQVIDGFKGKMLGKRWGNEFLTAYNTWGINLHIAFSSVRKHTSNTFSETNRLNISNQAIKFYPASKEYQDKFVQHVEQLFQKKIQKEAIINELTPVLEKALRDTGVLPTIEALYEHIKAKHNLDAVKSCSWEITAKFNNIKDEAVLVMKTKAELWVQQYRETKQQLPRQFSAEYTDLKALHGDYLVLHLYQAAITLHPRLSSTISESKADNKVCLPDTDAKSAGKVLATRHAVEHIIMTPDLHKDCVAQYQNNFTNFFAAYNNEATIIVTKIKQVNIDAQILADSHATKDKLFSKQQFDLNQNNMLFKDYFYQAYDAKLNEHRLLHAKAIAAGRAFAITPRNNSLPSFNASHAESNVDNKQYGLVGYAYEDGYLQAQTDVIQAKKLAEENIKNHFFKNIDSKIIISPAANLNDDINIVYTNSYQELFRKYLTEVQTGIQGAKASAESDNNFLTSCYQWGRNLRSILTEIWDGVDEYFAGRNQQLILDKAQEFYSANTQLKQDLIDQVARLCNLLRELAPLLRNGIKNNGVLPSINGPLCLPIKVKYPVLFDCIYAGLVNNKFISLREKHRAEHLADEHALKKLFAIEKSALQQQSGSEFFESHFYPAYQAKIDVYRDLYEKATAAGQALALQHHKNSLPQLQPADAVLQEESVVHGFYSNVFLENYEKMQEILNGVLTAGQQFGKGLAVTNFDGAGRDTEISNQSCLLYLDVASEMNLVSVKRSLFIRGAQLGFKQRLKSYLSTIAKTDALNQDALQQEARTAREVTATKFKAFGSDYIAAYDLVVTEITKVKQSAENDITINFFNDSGKQIITAPPALGDDKECAALYIKTYNALANKGLEAVKEGVKGVVIRSENDFLSQCYQWGRNLSAVVNQIWSYNSKTFTTANKIGAETHAKIKYPNQEGYQNEFVKQVGIIFDQKTIDETNKSKMLAELMPILAARAQDYDELPDLNSELFVSVQEKYPVKIFTENFSGLIKEKFDKIRKEVIKQKLDEQCSKACESARAAALNKQDKMPQQEAEARFGVFATNYFNVFDDMTKKVAAARQAGIDAAKAEDAFKSSQGKISSLSCLKRALSLDLAVFVADAASNDVVPDSGLNDKDLNNIYLEGFKMQRDGLQKVVPLYANQAWIEVWQSSEALKFDVSKITDKKVAYKHGYCLGFAVATMLKQPVLAEREKFLSAFAAQHFPSAKNNFEESVKLQLKTKLQQMLEKAEADAAKYSKQFAPMSVIPADVFANAKKLFSPESYKIFESKCKEFFPNEQSLLKSKALSIAKSAALAGQPRVSTSDAKNEFGIFESDYSSLYSQITDAKEIAINEADDRAKTSDDKKYLASYYLDTALSGNLFSYDESKVSDVPDSGLDDEDLKAIYCKTFRDRTEFLLRDVPVGAHQAWQVTMKPSCVLNQSKVIVDTPGYKYGYNLGVAVATIVQKNFSAAEQQKFVTDVANRSYPNDTFLRDELIREVNEWARKKIKSAAEYEKFFDDLDQEPSVSPKVLSHTASPATLMSSRGFHSSSSSAAAAASTRVTAPADIVTPRPSLIPK